MQISLRCCFNEIHPCWFVRGRLLCFLRGFIKSPRYNEIVEGRRNIPASMGIRRTVALNPLLYLLISFAVDVVSFEISARLLFILRIKFCLLFLVLVRM